MTYPGLKLLQRGQSTGLKNAAFSTAIIWSTAQRHTKRQSLYELTVSFRPRSRHCVSHELKHAVARRRGVPGAASLCHPKRRTLSYNLGKAPYPVLFLKVSRWRLLVLPDVRSSATMRCWPSGCLAGGICAVPHGLSNAPVPQALPSRRCGLTRGLLFPREAAVTPRADSSGHGFRRELPPGRACKPMCACGFDRRVWECQGSGRFLPSLFASALCILLSLLPVSDAFSEQSKSSETSKQFGASVPSDTFENVPQTLSGGDKARRIQRPKSAQAESCTRKCVSTCIRGGAGAPGEGPLNVRRPLVVFKEGFRSRQYCLLECSEICNLIPDGQDGP